MRELAASQIWHYLAKEVEKKNISMIIIKEVYLLYDVCSTD